MTHAPEPSGTLGGGPGPALWRWRLFDAAGQELDLEGSLTGHGPRFVSQGDAETWVGESWRDLADQGVESVLLLEGEREVYGPMSLRP